MVEVSKEFQVEIPFFDQQVEAFKAKLTKAKIAHGSRKSHGAEVVTVEVKALALMRENNISLPTIEYYLNF